MASAKLMIDDDFFYAMGQYALKQGKTINDAASSYISILNAVRQDAVIGGELAGAMDAYIGFAGKINNEALQVCESMQRQLEDFMTEIDDEDRW